MESFTSFTSFTTLPIDLKLKIVDQLDISIWTMFAIYDDDFRAYCIYYRKLFVKKFTVKHVTAARTCWTVFNKLHREELDDVTGNVLPAVISPVNISKIMYPVRPIKTINDVPCIVIPEERTNWLNEYNQEHKLDPAEEVIELLSDTATDRLRNFLTMRNNNLAIVGCGNNIEDIGDIISSVQPRADMQNTPTGMAYKITTSDYCYKIVNYEWRINKLLHRWYEPLNGVMQHMPAVVSASGYMEWRVNGILHREQTGADILPAIIHPNGECEYYINGIKY